MAAVEESHLVALKIARAMKPNTIADELLFQTAKHIVRVMIGEEYVNKLNCTYISLDTLHGRIADISADILDQIIQVMKSSTLAIISIQLDESTDLEIIYWFQGVYMNDILEISIIRFQTS
ncbi:Protein ZBED8 [Thelohanellus kitauei]|uniref:Protein ZBED8 n=1 Tax=Thelohanellus kitauei TaxID=669202 RepID=A0A0C2JGC5_THEKT|nr:Protein ZBED8 [Thelohanellus kitauei]